MFHVEPKFCQDMRKLTYINRSPEAGQPVAGGDSPVKEQSQTSAESKTAQAPAEAPAPDAKAQLKADLLQKMEKGKK